jgi:hypothetical protein
MEQKEPKALKSLSNVVVEIPARKRKQISIHRGDDQKVLSLT